MTWWEAASGVVIAAMTAWNSWTTRRANQTAASATNTVRSIEHELTPNGGDSLRDAVDRVHEQVVELVPMVKRNSERLGLLEQRATDAGWFYGGGR